MNTKASPDNSGDDDPLARELPGEGGVREALLRAASEELSVTGASGISLRAIARRAGVSHAAPKHHFGDRAGLLTALAVEGFRRLLVALERASAAVPDAPGGDLGALGRAYLATGLSDPPLFELMFRPELLHLDDPDLRSVQQATFDLLGGAVARLAHPRPGTAGAGLASAANNSETSLVAWAFVHGLVVLVRDGALQAAAGETDTELLAHRLTETFAELLQ